MNTDRALREHVLYLLGGGGAHLDFDRAIADLPEKLRGVRPAALPHSAWRLLEHLRICQWDILEFSRNPRHVSPEFPEATGPPATRRRTRPPGTVAWPPLPLT